MLHKLKDEQGILEEIVDLNRKEGASLRDNVASTADLPLFKVQQYGDLADQIP